MNFLFLDTVGYESDIRLSCHHYARLLSRRGHRVVSLSAPVSPLHRFARRSRRAVARRIDNHRRGFIAAPGGVHHYVPWTPVPVRNVFPLDRPWALRLSARGWMRDVLRRLDRMRFAPDVVSIQNMMFYPLARRFPRAVLHYRMVDLMEGFPDIPRSMLDYEEKILREADLISITSERFAFKTKGREARTLYAPNGVDLEHFAAPRPRPAAYGDDPAPIAVYIGALRAWFDWDLLAAAARAEPGVRFFVISPDAPREDARALSNFYYIPGVPYEEIPAYYQHAAVGAIPFRATPLVAGVNPIKMFECLAAGTPVVASDWPQLREMGAPARRAADAAGFVRALREAIAEKGERGRIDYSEFLARHTWEANLDALLERIEELRREGR